MPRLTGKFKQAEILSCGDFSGLPRGFDPATALSKAGNTADRADDGRVVALFPGEKDRAIARKNAVFPRHLVLSEGNTPDAKAIGALCVSVYQCVTPTLAIKIIKPLKN